MRVLIVEDEIMAQKSLTRVLMQNFSDMEIVGYTDSIKSTVNWLKDNTNSVDVIFMDVELADGTCFEIFRQVDVKAKVIMTTAYDSYALKAFEAGSIDYLLKPVDASALKRAVARCRMSGGNLDVEALMKALDRGLSKKEYKERCRALSENYGGRIKALRREYKAVMADLKGEELHIPALEKYDANMTYYSKKERVSRSFFKGE